MCEYFEDVVEKGPQEKERGIEKEQYQKMKMRDSKKYIYKHESNGRAPSQNKIPRGEKGLYKKENRAQMKYKITINQQLEMNQMVKEGRIMH